jgi:hypothetical protein
LQAIALLENRKCSEPSRTEVELPSIIRRYGYDLDDLDYCHHCKQIKRSIVHAKCQYTSSRGGKSGEVFYPTAVHIGKIKVYNVDQNSQNINDTLMLKKLVRDKKKRRALEEKMPVTCSKSFCSLCLKNFFDVDLDEVKADPYWVCPYCAGQCFCSRCRRLDQLTTARGYLISLNLKDLLFTPDRSDVVLGEEMMRSQHPLDMKIKQNFNISLQCADLTHACRQELLSDSELTRSLCMETKLGP